MNAKIRTALLLTLLLAALTACSENEPVDSETQADNTPSVDTVSADTPASEETAPAPDLPDVTFGGENFTFLSRYDTGTWDVLDAFTEGMVGEVLNDTIYERNLKVQEDYDVVIAENKVSDVSGEVKTAVQAGICEFDAIIGNAEMNLSMALANSLYDYHDVADIDLTQPWWDAQLNDSFELYGHQFYAISDMNIMAFDATWITMANTTILDNHGIKIDDLYEEVRQGTWTIDRYASIAEMNNRDVNNNSKTDSEDHYGTVMQGQGADGFLMGCGVQYIARQEDGTIALVPLSDHTVSIFEKVTGVVNKQTAFNSHDSSQNDKHGSDTEYGQVIFSENRATFFTETLQCVRRLREMETSFGVLPMPKYDEAQETYTSMVHYWATSMLSIPLNAPNIEKTGVILEYMSYISRDTVRDVYYDIVITDKYFRDAASTEMLDYVLEDRVMDLAYVLFGGGGIASDIRTKMYSGDTNYASIYKTQEKVINKTIEKQLSKFTETEQ